MNNNHDPLIGKYFHTFESDGTVSRQGVVLGKVTDLIYLVGLFEWVLGTMNVSRLVYLSTMMEWDFYDSAEEMHDKYENTYKVLADKKMKKEM